MRLSRRGVQSPTIRNPKRRSGKRFANDVLMFIAVYLIIFTIMQYVSFLVTGTEQTELIDKTFLVIGLECGGLLFKRIIDKIFKKDNTEE